MTSQLPTVICLLGPTASGKTRLVLELASRFEIDIISVDSAMVYRGMDIGTAKPEPAVLESFPHHLVNIRDPADTYSAGDFCSDLEPIIAQSLSHDRIPVLVGGTMLYFHAWQNGLAPLPQADESIRADLKQLAERIGWPAMHERLQAVDPIAAARISPQDAQRIERALEVYQLTGKPLSELHQNASPPTTRYRIVTIGLMIKDRDQLARQIELRFQDMLHKGFIEEVKALKAREDLHRDLAAMRAVGYRQVWRYLEGECDFKTMSTQAVTATRQLAKRQLTWLRSWKSMTHIDADQALTMPDQITNEFTR